jgi:anti-sigma factor RsiW
MKLPITDEYLLRYLNSELDANEVAALKAQLAEMPALTQRLDELRSIQTYLKQTSILEKPSSNFTTVVMQGLDRVKTQSISAKRGLILLIGSMVASGIVLGLLTLGAFDTSTSLLIESPVQNQLLELPKINIPFNTKVLINGIIFLNLGLLFVLLDRTILKPLFQNRATAG